MASKLKEAKTGLKVTSVTMTNEVKKQTKVPDGATIISETIRTEVRKIENGYIICKNIDTKYKEKGKEYNDYAYITKEWYTEDEPLDIDLTNTALADKFAV